MKPETPQNATPTYEQGSVLPPAGLEVVGGVPTLPRPEVGVLGGQERVEQAAEARAQVANMAVSSVSVALPVVDPAAGAQPTLQQPASGLVTPLTAADEDLIEKEWVDKARAIITQTKDDPHARTAQVNELQRNYLQKRFGKVLGADGDA